MLGSRFDGESFFAVDSARSRIQIGDWYQESLAVIPWSRFFLTISIAWLGKDWQGGSQYLVLQSKERTKLEESRGGFLLLFPEEDC